ncbi:hypothetical protein ACOBV8_18830 (plasmid) [Pseudoalteromonas espejiana]
MKTQTAAANTKIKRGIVAEAIEIKLPYISTENGLALQAVLKGTKFWVDSELN